MRTLTTATVITMSDMDSEMKATGKDHKKRQRIKKKQKKDEEINEILSKYHEVTEGVSFPDLFPSLRIRKGS